MAYRVVLICLHKLLHLPSDRTVIWSITTHLSGHVYIHLDQMFLITVILTCLKIFISLGGITDFIDSVSMLEDGVESLVTRQSAGTYTPNFGFRSLSSQDHVGY